MTLIAYLQIGNHLGGWFTFRYIKSSGQLLDMLKRVYGNKVKVRTIRTIRT